MRSMMHAYEDVDGVPCVASRELFTTTLRDEWGFDGIVVSDYAGIDELVESHAIVGDLGGGRRPGARGRHRRRAALAPSRTARRWRRRSPTGASTRRSSTARSRACWP